MPIDMKTDLFLRYFPKKSCYPNQLEAMRKIDGALREKKIILFEGACGTGKTLSSLAPSLQFAKENDKVVIIATSMHQQMLQFIEEAKEIKNSTDIKVVVLKGKILMCPRPDTDYETCDALRENTYNLRDKETDQYLLKDEIKTLRDRLKRTKDPNLHVLLKDLSEQWESSEKKLIEIKKNTCDHLLKVIKSEAEDFKGWLFSGVRTPEDVGAWAGEHGMCGYELLKREMKNADLVICNYHHVLNPEIREKVLAWLDREPSEIIAIFDEAHNIESSARAYSSITLSEITVKRAINEINENKQKIETFDHIALFLEKFYETIKSSYQLKLKFGERERIGKEWYDITICDPQEREDLFKAKLLKIFKESGINVKNALDMTRTFGLELDRRYEDQFKNGQSRIRKIAQSLYVATFLSDYLKLSDDLRYYPILNVRRDSGELYGRIELFTCVPKIVTEQFFKNIYSSILMSATLQPFDMVKATLGIERPACEIAYGMSFPIARRRTLAVNIPPLFAKDRSSPEIMRTILQVLQDIIENTGGNVLIFFPSSKEANQYGQNLKGHLLKANVPVFMDEAGIPSADIRDKFFKIGENGDKAVLISYLWGTLTEGVDYKNGRCRTVVIVGIGYPNLNDRVRAIQTAYDTEFSGRGWDFAIQIPTIRKVRQAMGRVVRSPDDFGARILLDARYMSTGKSRFGKYSVFEVFPQEERCEIIDVEPEKVKYSLINFFKENED